MSKYNREHYATVARLLRTHYDGTVSKNRDIENNVVDRIAEDFAAMFHDDNPGFARADFMIGVRLPKVKDNEARLQILERRMDILLKYGCVRINA